MLESGFVGLLRVNSGPDTVGGLLVEARRAGIDRLDAQLLVAHRLGQSRTWVIAHDESVVLPRSSAAIREGIRRRAEGEPLAYVLGWKEFRGLRLEVSPAVLVPRPDTETLVDWALELLDGPLREREPPVVADLGTGSGAIALAVKAAQPSARVLATDASAAALDIARRNAACLGLDVEFRLGDWWDAVGATVVDLAIANAPYIAEGDPHLTALRHEPSSALVSGEDGLDDIRTVVARSRRHLRDGGWLLLEHGDAQQPAVAALLANGGFAEIGLRTDLAGLRRCSGGRKPG